MSMNTPYRYTSAREEDDEKRPEPVGWIAQLVANAAKLPGVEGVQQAVTSTPAQNFLLGALDVVSRPNYAIASATDQVMRGKGASGLLEGLGKGITGESKTTFGDVLAEHGMGEGPRLGVGPLNVSARDVAGFGLDVVTDPTTYLTFGTGSLLKTGGRQVAGRLGQTALHVPFSGSVQRRLGVEGAQDIRREILPFDPLTAVARAGSYAVSGIPGGSQVKQTIKDTIGQVFQSNYALKKAGHGAFAEDLQRIQRAGRVYKEEAVETMARRFAPLTEQQRELFFKAADTGFDLADQEAERAISAARAAKAATPTEPWQMTKQEFGMPQIDNVMPGRRPYYVAMYHGDKLRDAPVGNVHQSRSFQTFEQASNARDKEHLKIVKAALKGGKPVPKEVLAEYPELAAKYPNAPSRVQQAVIPAIRATTGDPAVDTLLRWYRGEYQPWMKSIKEEMGLDSFLDNYIRHVFPEKLRGRAPAAGRPIQERNPGSFKQRKGAEGFSTDPAVALAVDYAETMTRKTVNDFVENTIALYGKRLKPKEVVPEGFAEYLPKGRLATYRSSSVPERVTRAIAEGGEAVVTADDLRKTLSVGQARRYALPKEMAEALNAMTNPKEQVLLFKALDATLSLWKASATTIWPAFHVRNAIGNFFLNWQAGISDPRVYLDAVKVRNLAKQVGDGALREVKERAVELDWAISADGRLVRGSAEGAIPLTDFVREAKMEGALSSGYYGEDIPAMLASAGGAGKLADKVNLFYLMRTAGKEIEDNARLAHVLGRMRLGDSFGDAVKSTKKHLFDYGDLSDVERGIRKVIPFYTWTRNNVPLQLEKLAREPRQAAAVAKVADMLGQDAGLTDEEKALMPDYVLERFGIVIGRDEQGNPKVINGLGLPIEDLNKLWSLTPERTRNRWLSDASFMLKAPLEMMFDYSTFTGRHISDDSYQNLYRQAYPFVAQVPGLRDWLEMTERKVQTKDGERTYYNVNPEKMYLLTSVLGRFYYTAGKATDPRKSMYDQVLNNISGIKIGSVDVKKAAASELRGEYTMAQERIYAERDDQLETIAQEVAKQQGHERQVLARRAYRDVRSEAMEEARIRLDVERSKDAARQTALTPEKEAALRSMMDPVERALEEYYAITPEAALDEFGQPDMKVFYTARDMFLEELPPEVRGKVKAKQLEYINKLPPNAARMEREYQAAINSYREYLRLPPFMVPVNEPELEKMQWLNRQYLALPDELSRGKWMVRLPAAERMLLNRYFQIRVNPSRQRQEYERKHPELQLWGFVS